MSLSDSAAKKNKIKKKDSAEAYSCMTPTITQLNSMPLTHTRPAWRHTAFRSFLANLTLESDDQGPELHNFNIRWEE